MKWGNLMLLRENLQSRSFCLTGRSDPTDFVRNIFSVRQRDQCLPLKCLRDTSKFQLGIYLNAQISHINLST